MSSSAICMASSAPLPLGASPPVSAMPKPMVSGLACAFTLTANPVTAPARASLLKVRRSMRMVSPPRLRFVRSEKLYETMSAGEVLVSCSLVRGEVRPGSRVGDLGGQTVGFDLGGVGGRSGWRRDPGGGCRHYTPGHSTRRFI